jgi:L-rhamnose mutarotase
MFIDANIYLDFYQMQGKPLLDFLEEQRAHIFVSKQIVDEVERNKLSTANRYFKSLCDRQTVVVSVGNKLHKHDYTQYMDVPKHLFEIPESEISEIRKAVDAAKKARKELWNLSVEMVQKISRSEDELSKRLQKVFSDAAQPTTEQMKRAREKKELGNPPGKKGDPLGDQISWEQFLCRCRLITRESPIQGVK